MPDARSSPLTARMRPMSRALSVASLAAMCAAAAADEIVQEGFLSGSAGPANEHSIDIERFDTLGGSLTLLEVRLDFTTILFAESVTNGAGGVVHGTAELWADYFFANGTPIAETSTSHDVMIDNTGKPVATLYLDIDEQTVSFVKPVALEPWTGTGSIALEALAQLTVAADPEGVVEWFAGGEVSWRATFVFEETPPCAADLDGDGAVGSTDLAQLLGAWGTPGADLTGDGATGADDLAALLAAWGGC
ncbi:MAG: hypothetical protein RI967_822 [Planctomycetota bacterium]